MKKRAIPFAVLAVIALAGICFKLQGAAANPQVIEISGNIEVTEVAVSFKIPGRVIERKVKEGEAVDAGTVVALLNPEELQKESAVQEAELQAAKAELAELEGGYLPEEISQAEARLLQAQATFDKQEADLSRQKQLFAGDVISKKEFDASNSAYAVAKAQVMEARENLTLLRKGVRKEKIAQGQARVDKARRALDLAEIKKGYATLRSPIKGYVLSENIEAGEFVNAGTPVVTVGTLDNVWLRGYINESDMGKVKLGQRVAVTTDSYPHKAYEGRVSFIASEAEFTPKNVQTEKERVKLVYRVKVDLSNPDHELKPGMPADGKIYLN